MSVTITIKMASLVSDIEVKSFMNTERIQNSEDKYNVRVSEENHAELVQSLQDTWRSLMRLCRRFLVKTTDTAGNDTMIATLATTDQTLVFDVTSRRTSNIADSLSQAIHEYLIGGTLRRFYTSAAIADLANLYLANEKNAGEEITQLLYRKDEPEYS